MSTLEEVKKMQAQGVPENEIIASLQDKGTSYREISEALNQSKIKAAVEQPIGEVQQPPTQTDVLSQTTSAAPQMPENTPPTQAAQPVIPEEKPQQPEQSIIPASPMQAPPLPQQPMQTPDAMAGMQQSIMQSDMPQQELPQEQYPQDSYAQDPYAQDQYAYDQNYQPYESASSGISPEIISEISEQIVAEKLLEVRKPLEKVIDFRNTIETKTEQIEERLKRIEKIIDTLQDSVLRKVGSYTENIEDIKKELIETQKSFTKLVPDLKKKTTKKKSSKKK